MTEKRNGKELILATKPFCVEDRFRSWAETIMTLTLLIISFGSTFLSIHIAFRLLLSGVTALFYVRMFVIYHDYQHHAILQKSKAATLLMKLFGIYILAPQNIWKRSHDYHHNHNSKLTISGIGSYPTISKKRFMNLSKSDKRIYLLNRHPLVIIFGYFTLFFYWLNIRSFLQSSRKHVDSIAAIVLHLIIGGLIFYFFGAVTFFISWFIPFFIAFAMGSYMFYCQHNFPGAVFRENPDWKYDAAAMYSTSFMAMPGWLNWFTGNIGYHHVHHMNSRIPFYRLRETMASMPELQDVVKTSWNPIEIYRCFRLKLWDEEQRKMVRL